MPSYDKLTAGQVILEQAFALHKMHDSTAWNGVLRSNCIPSDVPLYFDNDSSLIFCMFTTTCNTWDQVLIGQRRGYEGMITHGIHCAALLKHNVKPQMGRKIDTMRDVVSFQIMVYDYGPVLEELQPGRLWKQFVKSWMNFRDGPKRIRREILGKSTGLVEPEDD